MSYAVKEIFYTLQGEGANTGRPAVFCRFAGCNLWTGREKDRETAICSFCDTDFVGTDGPGGGRFSTASDLARAVSAAWPKPPEAEVRPLVVCTGGEPLLRRDLPMLVAKLADVQGIEDLSLTTNGLLLPRKLDALKKGDSEQ